MKKWKNLKHNYAKNVKKQLKSGCAAKGRKYIYAQQLTFLNSAQSSVTTENSITEENENKEQIEISNLIIQIQEGRALNEEIQIPKSSAKRKRCIEEAMLKLGL